MSKTLFAAIYVLVGLCSSAQADNRSDQMNPNNDAYWESRGYDERPDDWEYRSDDSYHDDNRSNQMNPNNDAYWQSRGYDGRHDDWEHESDDSYYDDNRSNQMNPKNDAHWRSRVYGGHPNNWEHRADEYDLGDDDHVGDALETRDIFAHKNEIQKGPSPIWSWFFKSDFPWLKFPGYLVLLLLVLIGQGRVR